MRSRDLSVVCNVDCDACSKQTIGHYSGTNSCPECLVRGRSGEELVEGVEAVLERFRLLELNVLDLHGTVERLENENRELTYRLRDAFGARED